MQHYVGTMEKQRGIDMIKTCLGCGKEFEHYTGHNIKYCSDTCRYKYNAKRKAERKEQSKYCPKPPAFDWSVESMAIERYKNDTYAERQKQRTLEMYGRIIVPPKGDNNG